MSTPAGGRNILRATSSEGESVGFQMSDDDLCVCGHQEGDHHVSWFPGIATVLGNPVKLVEECEYWYLDDLCKCQHYQKGIDHGRIED